MAEVEKSEEDIPNSMTVQIDEVLFTVDQLTHWQEQEISVSTLNWQPQGRTRQIEYYRAPLARYHSTMAASLARYQSTMAQRWSDDETDDEQEHDHRREPGYWESVDYCRFNNRRYCRY